MPPLHIKNIIVELNNNLLHTKLNKKVIEHFLSSIALNSMIASRKHKQESTITKPQSKAQKSREP